MGETTVEYCDTLSRVEGEAIRVLEYLPARDAYRERILYADERKESEIVEGYE